VSGAPGARRISAPVVIESEALRVTVDPRVGGTITAVEHKGLGAEQLQAPVNRTNFQNNVEWLTKHEYIPAADGESWRAMVLLRNDVSHPKDQIIVTPAMSLHMLEDTTRLVEGLYPE